MTEGGSAMASVQHIDSVMAVVRASLAYVRQMDPMARSCAVAILALAVLVVVASWRLQPAASHQVDQRTLNITPTAPLSTEQPQVQSNQSTIGSSSSSSSLQVTTSATTPASPSDSAQQAQVVVNGKDIALPDNSTVHKEITDTNGTTSVDVSVSSNTTSSNSSLNLNVRSDSQSSSSQSP